MITKRELVQRLYQPFFIVNNFSDVVMNRVINNLLRVDDNEFIDMYYKCTGHRLNALRKGLYY